MKPGGTAPRIRCHIQPIELLFNNLQPIGVGARCGPAVLLGWRELAGDAVGSKTNEVLTRRSLGLPLARNARGVEPNVLLAGRSPGGQGQRQYEFTCRDRTEEFDPRSD